MLAACGLACLAAFGCSTDQSATPGSATTRSHRQTEDPEEQPPFAGMTKDEVVQHYGRPKSIVLTDRGERWVYWLNEGEVVGKSLIPFYLPPRPRYGTLFFDGRGRVAEFHWDQVNDR